MRPLAGYGAAISCTRVVGQVRYSIEAIVGAGAGIAANAVVVAASEYGVLSVKVKRRRALTCAVLHRMRPYASDRHFEGLAAMSIIPDGEFTSLVQTYGYGVVGALIALESMGLPVPGETVLIGTAILAGTTHNLNIFVLVGIAAIGAIVGDNLGFWIGREAGFPLLIRYGSYFRITEGKVKLGQYLFLHHGGKVVFFGRFIAILRALAAFLAGVNGMSWRRFLVFNAGGGVTWAAVYGFGGWYFGNETSKFAGPAAIALGLIALAVLAVGFFYLRHHTARFEHEAEAALPGPIQRVRSRRA